MSGSLMAFLRKRPYAAWLGTSGAKIDIFARVQEVTEKRNEVVRAMAALIVRATEYVGNPEGLRENLTENLARPHLHIPETDLMQAIILLKPVLEGTEFLNSFAPLARFDRAYETIFDAFGVSEKKRNAWMASYRKDSGHLGEGHHH
jgi:hypothetical protein